MLEKLKLIGGQSWGNASHTLNSERVQLRLDRLRKSRPYFQIADEMELVPRHKKEALPDDNASLKN